MEVLGFLLVGGWIPVYLVYRVIRDGHEEREMQAWLARHWRKDGGS